VLFTTLTFFIFFWIVFVVYWGLKKRSPQNITLLVSSYLFYAWWDYRFLSLIVASTLIDYFGAISIERLKNGKTRRLLLSLCVGTNLLILAIFKYFDFFLDSLGSGLRLLGSDFELGSLNLILPLGISFYTFQTISYTVDVYRGKAKACSSLVDYASYVCFFPQLVAGPIERGKRLIPQFMNERRFSESKGKDGLRLVLWGVFKKMVIADNLANYVDPIYSNPESATGIFLIFATIAFAFQIYCDFSGYSDIAIGCAKLLGFDLMRNFAFPYFSQDVGEFWRRWHISLSTWFRDYIYIPLGGSRSSMGVWIRNVLITFILSGVWHGAAWNFVVWGGLCGIGYILFASESGKNPTKVPLGPELIPRPVALLKAGVLFTFICFTWIFFRAQSFGDALLIVGKIIGIGSEGEPFANALSYIVNILGYIMPLVVIEFLTRKHEHPFHIATKWPVAGRWLAYVATILIVLYFMPENQAEFVYFQF